MEEIWKTIPTLDGYEASSLGRIRSVDRVVKCFSSIKNQYLKVPIVVEQTRPIRGKIIKPKYYPHKNPYMFFGASRDSDGKRKTMSVHRAVCLAFHGMSPIENAHAAHLDGNETNNAPDNLMWTTVMENHSHKKKHGTKIEGSKHYATKLTEDTVKEILNEYKNGEKIYLVAKKFSISSGCVSGIVHRKSWKHVTI